MIYKISKLGLSVIVFITLLSVSNAQQDPHYTQYMYNTMAINPAYAGQRETLSITGLFRAQWVGLDGAPQTLTFGAHSPLPDDRMGVGLSVINDRLGPADETYLNGNFSYSILLNGYDTKLSLGLSAGVHQLQTNWSRGSFQNPDRVFSENLNLTSPILGSGVYLHSSKWYFGVSVPNLIETEHYDDFEESVGVEQIHYFLIGGYVFDLTYNLKFKPAFMARAVSGAPLIADVSANFLFNDRFSGGVAWRWDDSVSALAGFHVNDSIYIGYAYDLNTSGFNNYNSGTHEIMLRFEISKANGRYVSPRFF